jgi:hypothetical protein
MKRRIHWIALLIMSLLAACAGKDTPLPTGPPELRVTDISPLSVRQFVDSVDLVLFYADPEGDLGSEDPDDKTLWVKDSRLAEADLYHVRPLSPPEGDPVSIQGTLVVRLKSVFLLGNGQSEQITYSVKIRDKAGNWSETDIAPTITVTQ